MRQNHVKMTRFSTGVLRAFVTNVDRSLLNLMASKSSGSTSIDRMSMIETVASSVSFHDLDTHECDGEVLTRRILLKE